VAFPLRTLVTTRLHTFPRQRHPPSWNGTAKNSVQYCNQNEAEEAMTSSKANFLSFHWCFILIFNCFEINGGNIWTCIRWFIPPEQNSWLSHWQRGSGSTASTPVLDVSAPAGTHGLWPLCGLWLWRVWEDQTVDHVVFPCPIYRPPHGLHGLTLLNDETIEWLLNTCPVI